MATDDDNEPRAKELLDRPLEEVVDEATRAQLARWFGLPSFQQVEEGEVALPVEDPEIVAVRERRQKAIEAVDPRLLDSHRARYEKAWSLLEFEATLETVIDPDLALFDYAMAEGRMQIAEPREVERPEDISDQMEENTPQALLRDLHRPELQFDKTFEVVDVSAEQKLDGVAAVREAIATNWKLPSLADPPSVELRRIMNEMRAEHRAPWGDIPKRAHLPNRRVED